MKNKFTCVLKFRDENMPKMYQEESTKDLAISTLYHWSKQFAGIGIMYFINPKKDMVVFNQLGEYWFTLPSRL